MRFRLNIRSGIQTPEKKRHYNAGLFTRVAREYDSATRAMSLGRDQAWKRWLVESLPPLPSPRCVDLACGTGDVTAALAKRFAHGQIIGVDLTPAMVEVARRRCPQPNVEF